MPSPNLGCRSDLLIKMSSSSAASALNSARNVAHSSRSLGRIAQNNVHATRSAGRGAHLPLDRSEARFPVQILHPSLQPKKSTNAKRSSSTPSKISKASDGTPRLGAGRGSSIRHPHKFSPEQMEEDSLSIHASMSRPVGPRRGAPRERTGLAAAVLDSPPDSSTSSPRGRRWSRKPSHERSGYSSRQERSPVSSLVPAAIDPLHGGACSQRASNSIYEKGMAALDDMKDVGDWENHPAVKMRARPTHITAALKADPSVEPYRAPIESESLVNVRLTDGRVRVGDEAPPFAWGDLNKAVEHLPPGHWAYNYIKSVVHSVQFNGGLLAGQKEQMLAVVLKTLAELSQRKEDYDRFQDAE